MNNKFQIFFTIMLMGFASIYAIPSKFNNSGLEAENVRLQRGTLDEAKTTSTTTATPQEEATPNTVITKENTDEINAVKVEEIKQESQVQEAKEDDEDDDGDILGLDYKDKAYISYCIPRYLEDEQTRSIIELFTGEEFSHGYLIMRTKPKKRAGMYFFVMVGYGPDDIALASIIDVYVDSTDANKTRKFEFIVPETHSVLREIKLGITGSDWPNDDARVNAWKVVIKDSTGKVLAEKESWLWSIKNSDKQ